MVPGIVFMILLRDNSVSCDGATTVCDVSAPTSSCNVLWCCPKHYDYYDINGGRGPGTDAYASAGCYQVFGNSSVVPSDPDRGDFADYCAKGKVAPIKGCNCEIHRGNKGRENWDCDAVFIDGEKGNYFFTASNIAWTLSAGMACIQLGWILPFAFYCKKSGDAAKWLRDDHFADWVQRGVSLHYTRPTKHTQGALSLTLPAGYVGQAQPIMVVQAQVLTK
jgi:hypothetical protein